MIEFQRGLDYPYGQSSQLQELHRCFHLLNKYHKAKQSLLLFLSGLERNSGDYNLNLLRDRSKELQRASWIGIAGNAVLAVIKIMIGFISGSFAVIGDGIDTATDVLTYMITLITARIISKPPDPKYPYGYKKAETAATKILAFIIFFAGAELFFQL